MYLEGIYDCIMERFETIIIIGGEEFCVNSKSSNNARVKLKRLFYKDVTVRLSTTDNDVTKIVNHGLVQAGDCGQHCVEDVLRAMLENRMETEREYLERVVENSIVMRILCDELQKCVTDVSMFENEKAHIMKYYKDSYKKRYADFRDYFCREIRKQQEFQCNPDLKCGDLICWAIAKCLIGLTFRTKKESEKKGVSQKDIEKITSLQDELAKIVDSFFGNGSSEKLDDYYVRLWNEYHRVKLRDGDGSIKTEIIETMIIPDIRDERGRKKIEVPFGDGSRIQFIYANSGIGKSHMLKSVVVACTVDYIYANHKELMSKNEITAYERGKYSEIKHYYFGDKCSNKIPVFIQASKFNEVYLIEEDACPRKEIFLGLCNFYEIIANTINSKEDKVIFLIDSLDEIEEDRVKSFNWLLCSMIEKDYRKNQFIITSRFSGRDIHINSIKVMNLKGFDDTTVYQFLDKCSFLETSKKLADFIGSNEYAFELAQNPFMLTAMLDITDGLSVKRILDKITFKIIRLRMNYEMLAMDDKAVRSILSYLAFYYVFLKEDNSVFGKGYIATKILEARDQGLINLTGEDNFVSDEQIKLFANMLSCQSGIIILTSEEGRVKFEFQDELVMCYLAAEFIRNLASAADVPDDYRFTIYRNNKELDKSLIEIDRFFKWLGRHGNRLYTERFCKVINMVIQMDNKSLSVVLLYYMLMCGFMSVERDAMQNLRTFFVEYYEKKYGDNILLERPEEIEQINLLIERFLKITINN